MTTTNERISDSDLTVIVERGAQGSWDSATAASSTAKWADVSPMTKNAYRERVLPVIFHGTKALHDLGFRKPRIITTAEELDAVAGGAVLRSSSGTIASRFNRGYGVLFGDDRPIEWARLALPATVLWEPEAGEAA